MHRLLLAQAKDDDFNSFLPLSPCKSAQAANGTDCETTDSMARPLRIQAAGLCYHITARGNNRMAIYLDDHDRREFLDALARVVESHHVVCHAFCLMTDHYHMVATTTEANVSGALKQLNGIYGQWWNRSHGRVGHVFQGRFGARIIQDDAYLVTACRYVVLNPVRAHLVADPAAWRWSSYRATAGLAAVPSFLSPEFLWARLGGADANASAGRYREFVGAGDPDGGQLPEGPIVGDAMFVGRFQRWRVEASREVARKEREVRQPLESVFEAAITRSLRNRGVLRAAGIGYTLREIADYLGVHPTTVSRIANGVSGGQIMNNATVQDLTPSGGQI